MDNQGIPSARITKEEQKQLMATAVEALSSLPSQVQNSSHAESQDVGDTNAESQEPTKVDFTTHNKGTAAETRDTRLPVVKSSSVFDRLYKSHTVASKSHSLSSIASLKPSTRANLPIKNTSGTSIEAELSNFNRMTISRSKRACTPHKIDLEGRKTSSAFPFSTPPPSHRRKRPSSQHRAPHTAPSKPSAGSPLYATPRSAKRVYEFSPRMKPLTKLYFVSKFHPGVGLEPVEPISLGYNFFQMFCEYETGGIDSEDIAKIICIAFFKKDHSRSIRHWKLNEPVVGKKTKANKGRRGGTVYPITMHATYAWGNSYRVVHAKGTVRFKGSTSKEIWVENFTYNVRGDP